MKYLYKTEKYIKIVKGHIKHHLLYLFLRKVKSKIVNGSAKTTYTYPVIFIIMLYIPSDLVV